MNALTEFTHETIEVDGRKVEIEYSKRKNILSVVLSHGMYNNMHTSLIEKLFARLGGDYNVLRFNFSFAGYPESADAERSVKELEAVAKLLGNDKLVLIGKSLGGYISSLAAAKSRGSALKVIALGYSLHEEGKPSTVFDLDGVKDMKVPLIVIKGSDDPYCDNAVLKEKLPNCKIYTIAGAEHSFKPVSGKGSRDANEEKVISLVMKELEEIA